MEWLIYLALVCVTIHLIRMWFKTRKVGQFHEKYVFITGCDSGFGRELVVRLDGMGFHVFAGCLTSNGQTSLEEQCSRRVLTLALDVTKDDSIARALDFVKDHLPPEKGIWAVVNNAGIFGNFVSSEMLERRDFLTPLEVNLLGPIEVNKVFLPLVRKGKGRLVTMTSISGRFPMGASPYAVSKSALEAYLDVLRKEIYDQGVYVSMIEPGGVHTNLMDSIKPQIQASYNKASDEIKKIYGQTYWSDRQTGIDLIKRFPTGISHVVDTYVKALTDRFPQTRYVVGYDAKFLFLPLSYLPDRIGDFVIHSMEGLIILGQKWNLL